jgi:hypothetical protein
MRQCAVHHAEPLYVVGEAYDGRCRICWLYVNDPAHRRLWSEWPITTFARRLGRPLTTFARALARHIRDWCRAASKYEQARRRSICDDCPFRNVEKDRCTKCGCSLSGLLLNKIRWRSEHCPIGKW